MELVALLIVFVSTATLAWALMPDTSRRTVQRRIYKEVKARRAPSKLAQLTSLLSPINARLATGWYHDRTTSMLSAAGLRIPPIQTLVVQEMGALTGAIVYIVTMGTEGFNLLIFLVFVVVGFIIPSFWLKGKIRARRQTFTRDLPDVVDLLTLCVVAGSDFMGALNRIVREFRPCPIRDELQIVLQEVRLGKRRRDALKGFAQRVQVPEANTFARVLIQVDRMGTGLADAMTILSEDIRLARYHWAERFASQAPIKLLLPLIFSLFASMAIVAGPILIKFMRGGLMSPQMSAAAHGKADK